MSLPTKPNNYLDPQEKERLLMQYAGIFRHQIKEYGETMKKAINRPKKNYSK